MMKLSWLDIVSVVQRLSDTLCDWGEMRKSSEQFLLLDFRQSFMDMTICLYGILIQKKWKKSGDIVMRLSA